MCNTHELGLVWDAVIGLVATPGTNWARKPGVNGASVNATLAGAWWEQMTIDGGVHWGTAINLLKAHTILEQIEARGRASQDAS